MSLQTTLYDMRDQAFLSFNSLILPSTNNHLIISLGSLFHHTIMHFSHALLAALASVGLADAASIAPRASCIFTDSVSAIKGKSSCSSIVLKDIAVPAGTTLDMTKLKDGTHVRFTTRVKLGLNS